MQSHRRIRSIAMRAIGQPLRGGLTLILKQRGIPLLALRQRGLRLPAVEPAREQLAAAAGPATARVLPCGGAADGFDQQLRPFAALEPVDAEGVGLRAASAENVTVTTGVSSTNASKGAAAVDKRVSHLRIAAAFAAILAKAIRRPRTLAESKLAVGFWCLLPCSLGGRPPNAERGPEFKCWLVRGPASRRPGAPGGLCLPPDVRQARSETRTASATAPRGAPLARHPQSGLA